MGRPAKATKLLSGHITKDDAAARLAVEDELKGASDKIIAPDWLNEGQREVFSFVVAELEASGILGNVDIYVLSQFAVSTERLFDIEQDINDNPGRVYNKDQIFARNSYEKSFWRGANELSLSPQARAKAGAIIREKAEEEKDPLKKLLVGKGN